MGEQQIVQAFAQAFRIPHLETNSFLYGEVPPSFKPFSANPESVQTQNLAENKENRTPIKQNFLVSPPTDQNLTHLTQKDPKKKTTSDAVENAGNAESRVNTERGSVATQDTTAESQIADGQLIDECRKLLQEVRNLKKKKSVVAGNPERKIVTYHVMEKVTMPPVIRYTEKTSLDRELDRKKIDIAPVETSENFLNQRKQMRRLSFNMTPVPPDHTIRSSVSSLVSQPMSLYKVTQEYSSSVHPGKPATKHKKKRSAAGLKSDGMYLKQVYEVIEAHAKHCTDLRKDLKTLKGEYQTNLAKRK